MMFTFYMMRGGGGGGGESLETAATCVCGVDGERRKDTLGFTSFVLYLNRSSHQTHGTQLNTQIDTTHTLEPCS